jgi:hypothetical protein
MKTRDATPADLPAQNSVIPAHAGIQGFSAVSPATLGPRFRGDDEVEEGADRP